MSTHSRRWASRANRNTASVVALAIASMGSLCTASGVSASATTDIGELLAKLATAEQLVMVRTTMPQPTKGANDMGGNVDVLLAKLECSGDKCPSAKLLVRAGGTSAYSDQTVDPTAALPTDPGVYELKVSDSGLTIESTSMVACVDATTGEANGPSETTSQWKYDLAASTQAGAVVLRGTVRNSLTNPGSATCKKENAVSDAEVAIFDPTQGEATSPAPDEWHSTVQTGTGFAVISIDVRDCEDADPTPCEFVVREQRPAALPDGTGGHYVVEHVMTGSAENGFSGGHDYLGGCFIDNKYQADALKVTTDLKIHAVTVGGGQYLHLQRTRRQEPTGKGTCVGTTLVTDSWFAAYHGAHLDIDATAPPGTIVPNAGATSTPTTVTSTSVTGGKSGYGVVDGTIKDAKIFVLFALDIAKKLGQRGADVDMELIAQTIGATPTKSTPDSAATPEHPIVFGPVKTASSSMSGLFASDGHLCAMGLVISTPGGPGSKLERRFATTTDLTKCTTKGFTEIAGSGMTVMPENS